MIDKKVLTLTLIGLLVIVVSVVLNLFVINQDKAKKSQEGSQEISINQVTVDNKVVELGFRFDPVTLTVGQTATAKLFVKSVNNTTKLINGESIFLSILLDNNLQVNEADLPDSFDRDLKINGSKFAVIFYNSVKRNINLSLLMSSGTFELKPGTVIYSFPISSDNAGSFKVSIREPDGQLYVPSITDNSSNEVLIINPLPFANITYAPEVTNTAPIISGDPVTTVNENQDYSFTPTVTDAENDPLTFSILNTPNWAVFDTTTGKLSGKPSYT
ncbi:MAG: hypothetical protein O2871_02200, partial [bacterium]|nr:hypothetical protein [bacterium]